MGLFNMYSSIIKEYILVSNILTKNEKDELKNFIDSYSPL